MESNTESTQPKVFLSKKEKKQKKQAEKEDDIVGQRMEEFMIHKEQVPPPTVVHDNPNPFKNDIILPNVQLIAGGQHLLEDTQLRLVQGRKYGLVGRNGIGKTTLINAICRKELEGFPQDIHILQVE